MLRFLSIRNLAVIDRLELEFEPGLNVLTGETGAGKSMLVDALGLLLGGRSDSQAVRPGAGRAVCPLGRGAQGPAQAAGPDPARPRLSPRPGLDPDAPAASGAPVLARAGRPGADREA